MSNLQRLSIKIASRTCRSAIFVFGERLQKESLGEYGSGWGWDKEYAHVFDQETTFTDNNYPSTLFITPIRYLNNGTTISNCLYNTEYTTGQVLYSGSAMTKQESCKPNTGNAGNYYSQIATMTIDYSGKNSICPKGWQIVKTGQVDYGHLGNTIYGIANPNNKVLILPFSYTASGYYDSSNSTNRGGFGSYWMSGQQMSFTASSNSYKSNNWENSGRSLRCGG